jgi:2-hydroxychromene-2-carboxylate isomerase
VTDEKWPSCDPEYIFSRKSVDIATVFPNVYVWWSQDRRRRRISQTTEGMNMGVVIDLEGRRRARDARPAARRGTARVQLFFDLGDPYSYLAAERVERAFDAVTWTPASARGLLAPARPWEHAEARAVELRLPLQWPERHPAPVVRAMRVASLAAECGRGAEFALAAGRLAFGGGYDLDDTETLVEAAAAAGIGLEATLRAAADARRDAAMEAAGRRLHAEGADRLPALLVDGAVFWGEERVAEALAAARWAAAAGV